MEQRHDDHLFTYISSLSFPLVYKKKLQTEMCRDYDTYTCACMVFSVKKTNDVFNLKKVRILRN